MNEETLKLKEQLRTILTEYQEQVQLKQQQLFVIGCSTSEVIGQKIGTAGTVDVASLIFKECQNISSKQEFRLLFNAVNI